MDMTQNDLDRLMFFEHARKTAEVQYETNPLDADNLTRWAGALLELSQFQSVSESKTMIKDCISKLDEALAVDPRKHEALWCKGNAYTSQAFLTPELDMAKVCFDKANQCFERAVEEEPSNELYIKSLQMNAKAPELHMEIHKHGMGQQLAGGGGSSASSNVKGSKKKRDNDFYYDLGGWVILGIGICAIIGMMNSRVQTPPPM